MFSCFKFLKLFIKLLLIRLSLAFVKGLIVLFRSNALAPPLRIETSGLEFLLLFFDMVDLNNHEGIPISSLFFLSFVRYGVTLGSSSFKIFKFK